MGIPKPKQFFTVAEYLVQERAAFERSEYLDGEVFAMAGEKRPHGGISTNMIVSIGSQIKGKPCHAYFKNMKVRSGPFPKSQQSQRGLYSYPDVVVVCGEVECHDEHEDVILNPKVIVEVLSESTVALDRGEKLKRYFQWNPTLTDYLLVTQMKPEIEHFHRQSKDMWSFRVYGGLEAVVAVDSIGCTLKLSDVYDRIVFPEDDKAKTSRRRKPPRRKR